MKVKLNDIKQSGLEISNQLDLVRLNNRMNESKNNDIFFTANPEYSVKITPDNLGFIFSGTITGVYQQPCSLCVKDLENKISSKFSYNLRKSGDETENENVVFFNDENYEIDDLLEEELILKTTPYLRPAVEDETCRTCGKNVKSLLEIKKSDTFSLGDLLKGVIK